VEPRPLVAVQHMAATSAPELLTAAPAAFDAAAHATAPAIAPVTASALTEAEAEAPPPPTATPPVPVPVAVPMATIPPAVATPPATAPPANDSPEPVTPEPVSAAVSAAVPPEPLPLAAAPAPAPVEALPITAVQAPSDTAPNELLSARKLRDPAKLASDLSEEQAIRKQARVGYPTQFELLLLRTLPATPCQAEATVGKLLQPASQAADRAGRLWNEPATDPNQLKHACKASAEMLLYGVIFAGDVAWRGIAGVACKCALKPVA